MFCVEEKGIVYTLTYASNWVLCVQCCSGARIYPMGLFRLQFTGNLKYSVELNAFCCGGQFRQNKETILVVLEPGL